CDERHLDAVVAESLRQLDELAAGRFGDDELAATTATIAGSLAAVDDSLTSRTAFTAEQWLLGQDQDPAARIACYPAVRPDAVAAAAGGLWLDHEHALVPAAARA